MNTKQDGWLDEVLERESANILGGRPSQTHNAQRKRRLNSIENPTPAPRLADAFARESIDSIAYINRGALLLSLYGDLTKAAALCRKAISTCAENRQVGHWGWEWMAITSYQNLGRLYAMEGKCEDALAIFSKIYHFFLHKLPLHVLDLIVVEPDEERRTIAQKAGDDFGETTPYAYLHSSARCYMIANRYPELLDFLNHLESTPDIVRVDGFLSVLYETYARTFLALSRPQEAMGALRQLAQLGSGQAITRLLLCQAHQMMQDEAEAFSSVEVLTQWLLKMEHYPPIYGYLCSLLLARLGRFELARQVALSALQQCNATGDKPCTMKVLALLAHICHRNGGMAERQGSAAWCDHLLAAAAECEFQYETGVAFSDAATLLDPDSHAQPVTPIGCLHRARELMAPLQHWSARLITKQLSQMLGNSPKMEAEMPRCAPFPNPHAEAIYARLSASSEHAPCTMENQSKSMETTQPGRRRSA